MTEEITHIDPSELTPHVLHEHIYGKAENGEGFTELLKDIEANGMLQPLIVDRHNVVVSGSRRLAVAKALKMEEIPALIFDFKNEASLIQHFISYNEYRVKTQIQKVREGLTYQAMLQEVMAAEIDGKTLKSDHILMKIASADGKIITRNAAGAIVGLSPRTIQTGKKVVETIEELRKEGREDEAAEIEKKAKTSISGAEKLADKAKPKVQTPQDILYWYTNSLWRVSTSIRNQVTALRTKMNSKTPAGLSWFVGNMLEMADRIDTWQPPNMTDCPVCKGTMSVEGHPCSICIQGKTGLYRVPDDVQAPDEKDKTYCGVCGMETLEGDICGPCEIKARQKEEKELHVKITCEECGDPVGYYDKDGNDHLNKGVVLTDDGNYYCPPCKRELDAEKGSNEG